MFEFIKTQAIGIAAGVIGAVIIGSCGAVLCYAIHKVLMFFGEE